MAFIDLFYPRYSLLAHVFAVVLALFAVYRWYKSQSDAIFWMVAAIFVAVHGLHHHMLELELRQKKKQ